MIDLGFTRLVGEAPTALTEQIVSRVLAGGADLKLDVEDMRPKHLAAFAGMCGKTLAFAHARSGDAMMIRGYIGDDETFDDVIVEYADRYADLTERDHAHLSEAIDDGAIEAVCDI